MGGGNGELGHWLPFFKIHVGLPLSDLVWEHPLMCAWAVQGTGEALLSSGTPWRAGFLAVWKARWSIWRHANKRHKSFYLSSENRLVVILIKDNCIIFFLRAWIGQIGNLTWQTSKLHLNIRKRDNMQRWWSNVLRDILSTSVRLRNLSCHFLHPSLLCFRLIRKHGSLKQ